MDRGRAPNGIGHLMILIDLNGFVFFLIFQRAIGWIIILA